MGKPTRCLPPHQAANARSSTPTAGSTLRPCVQALQLLPVGAADGGRMVQGAFGKGTLSLTSFFTYVGLALGLLGSSLALPYGIYVLVCLRTAERYIADNVTPAGDARATATWAAVAFAVLVLVPMAPELSEAWGVGPGKDAFFF